MTEQKPNLMDDLLQRQAEYFAGKLSDLEYIAVVNWVLSAEQQWRDSEADPEGWTKRMLAQADRAGLLTEEQRVAAGLAESEAAGSQP